MNKGKTKKYEDPNPLWNIMNHSNAVFNWKELTEGAPSIYLDTLDCLLGEREILWAYCSIQPENMEWKAWKTKPHSKPQIASLSHNLMAMIWYTRKPCLHIFWGACENAFYVLVPEHRWPGFQGKSIMGHDNQWLLLGPLSWYPIILFKSLYFTWKIRVLIQYKDDVLPV